MLDSLNQAQRRAVTHDQGPILVIAGAGTGKTRVITQRVAWLIESGKAKPEQILALTFTEKAAEEMAGRVTDLLPLSYAPPEVHTFHAFGQLLLQESGLEIGLDTRFEVLSKAQQWLLMKQHIFDLPLDYFRPQGNPLRMIDALLTHFSRAKDETVTPEQYRAYADQLLTEAGTTAESLKNRFAHGDLDADAEELYKTWEIGQVYQAYQDLLLRDPKQVRLDFGDLILQSLSLIRERPSVLRRYQERFRYILVDEFQDTNYAQNQLVQQLAGSHRNLMVVGDDDQSIYRFRGAAVSNILQFETDYPEAEVVVLTENYRSTQAILDHAYGLIQHNNPDRLEIKNNIDKRLISQQGDGAEPEVLRAVSHTDEADLVVREILERMGFDLPAEGAPGEQVVMEWARSAPDEGPRWGDFAILARAGSHLDPFVQALRYYNIPFQLLGTQGLYEQEEIKDLIAYLQVLANPDDGNHWFRLLDWSLCGVKPVTLLEIFRYARKQNHALWDVLRNPGQIEWLAEGEPERILQMVGHVQQGREQLAEHNVGEVLWGFVQDLGVIQQLEAEQTIEAANKILNIGKFFEQIKRFIGGQENTSVTAFLDYLEMMIEAGDSPSTADADTGADAVNLLTVHASKGLEFDHVFLVSLVGQRFPTRNRSEALPLPEGLIREQLPEGDEHLQEERRLFYVGMTRARRRLYLSYAEDYGGKRQRKPSVFLEEAMKTLPDTPREVSLPERAAPKLVPEAQQAVSLAQHLPKTVSHSQFNTFDQCPLQYKYAYIYQVPREPEAPLVFGDVIHQTLRDFYHEMTTAGTSLERLLALFEQHWRREGFISGRDVEIQHQAGREMLESFHARERDQFKPAAFLEKPFYLPIQPYTIKGVIDRIDRLPDGTYEIIDYKTGVMEDRDKLEKKVAKDEQLSLYALAARDQLGLEVSKLTLYYLQPGWQASTTRSSEDLAKVADKVRAQAEAIHRSDFPPKPSTFTCEHCPYRRICPFAAG